MMNPDEWKANVLRLRGDVQTCIRLIEDAWHGCDGRSILDAADGLDECAAKAQELYLVLKKGLE